MGVGLASRVGAELADFGRSASGWGGLWRTMAGLLGWLRLTFLAGEPPGAWRAGTG